jgi:hypothetical protein
MSPSPLQLRRSDTAHKRPAPADLLEGEVVVNYSPDSSGLFFKDSSGSVVKIGPVAVSASAPNSTPSGESGNCEGELWYEPSTQALKVFHNSEWVTVATPTPVGYTGEVLVGDTTFTIVDGIIADITKEPPIG